MKKSILVINGPNINLLGKREPQIYGNETYEDICDIIRKYSDSKGVELEIFQSNHEGDIIDKLHQADGSFTGVILNAGAFTHYSYAIKDAVKSIATPVIEVHISNIYKREEFRHKSVLTDACLGQICGFGYHSYLLAVSALAEDFPTE